MKYLKVWTNFLQLIDTLEYDEIGRLFEMMLIYAETGREPENFDGNEKFLWPVARQQIDFAAMRNETLRQNGMKGGRPKTKETKQNQTEPNRTRANQTKAYKDKDNDKDKDKEIESIDARFAQFWSEYPNKVKKPEAMKAWKALNPDELLFSDILQGLARWKNSDQWTRDDGRYIPHPATWLHGRQWEDQVQPKKPIRMVAAQAYTQRDYSGEQEEAMARMIAGGAHGS